LTGNKELLRWTYFDPERERPLSLDTTPTADRSYNREALTFTEESVTLGDVFRDDWARLYGDLYGTLRENKPLEIIPESVRRQIYILGKCREAAGWG